MTSLMVKNVPTICIDGKIVFVSQIPPKEELVSAIRRRIFEKLHYKIRAKKGEILVLGKTAEECAALKASVQKAVRELGTDIPVIEVTDEKQIESYGISRTPAVVVVQYKIKTEGREPHAVALKEWLKELQ
jgi:uroporphyrinogen decarboxylase